MFSKVYLPFQSSMTIHHEYLNTTLFGLYFLCLRSNKYCFIFLHMITVNTVLTIITYLITIYPCSLNIYMYHVDMFSCSFTF